jgi:hypothetical protein
LLEKIDQFAELAQVDHVERVGLDRKSRVRVAVKAADHHALPSRPRAAGHKKGELAGTGHNAYGVHTYS